MQPSTMKMIERLLQLQGRNELWSGVIANQTLDRERERQAKSISREDAAAAKAMGWPEVDVDSDDMGTILGDVNIQQPTQTGGGLGKVIAAALLGAAIPAAGAIGYWLAAKPIEKTAAEAIDTHTQIGLGHISDYLEEQ